MSEEYRIVEKRRWMPNAEVEVCRVCGSREVHSREYGKPKVECISALREEISALKQKYSPQEPKDWTEEFLRKKKAEEDAGKSVKFDKIGESPQEPLPWERVIEGVVISLSNFKPSDYLDGGEKMVSECVAELKEILSRFQERGGEK